MSNPKWKCIYEELLQHGDTLAVELVDGALSYYCPKSGRAVDGRSVKAMLSRDLLRPVGPSIDPDFPQAYEAVPEAA